jgi:hypothetical protein
MRETNPVLAQVGACLGWIELEGHRPLCILNAYAQVGPTALGQGARTQAGLA